MIDLTEYARQRYKGKTIYKKNALVKFELITKLVSGYNRILDLACGDGTLTNMMRKNNQVYGIDINDCDLQKDPIPFKENNFDVVVASEIIEHIWDCDRLLQDIKRVLKPNGQLIISTPNLASLGRRLLLVIGSNPYIENHLYPDEAGHIKHFVRKDLKYLLNRNGFKVNDWWSDVIILSRDGKWYSEFLAGIFPRLGRSIIAVCTY